MAERRRNVAEAMLLRICIILLTVAALLSPAAFAAGDSSGGGAAIPLYMDWSDPADGASDISVMPVIQCKFSHNVAQGSGSEQNKTLITLEAAGGTNVDINVFMADAQIEFDKRQFIYISPVEPLSYGTTYILTVHEGIQAKNGMTTDQVQTVTFTTECGQSSADEPQVSPPDFDGVREPEGSLPAENGAAPSVESAAGPAMAVSDGKADDGEDSQGSGSEGESAFFPAGEAGTAGNLNEDEGISGNGGESYKVGADGGNDGIEPFFAMGLNWAAAVLLSCLIVGAAAAGIWIGRKNRSGKK